MKDRNRVPVLDKTCARRKGGFSIRLYYYDETGKRRSARAYGASCAEARQDARDRWWSEVRRVRDIFAGRIAPERPSTRVTFAELVAASMPTLRLAQRPRQVRTTVHYMARFWAPCCPSCGRINEGAYERANEGLTVVAESCAECHAPLLGATPIGEITTALCNRVLSSTRGMVADSTLNRVASAAAAVFRHAVDAEWLASAPTDGVRRMTEGRKVRPLISGAEALALAKALEEPWRPFVLLMLCAGLRLTEARLLRPVDLELDRGLIVVRLGGAGDSPKSGHQRRCRSSRRCSTAPYGPRCSAVAPRSPTSRSPAAPSAGRRWPRTWTACPRGTSCGTGSARRRWSAAWRRRRCGGGWGTRRWR